ncbi:MAG: hypothetical protein PHD29_05425 [bacterium]|nr:hypothetical protein [bacterium]MDD5354418.1 hypothetical protein [bacterium]MDD5755706.1 hypothetical protein [bacterium]
MKAKRLYWYSGVMVLVLYVLCLNYRFGFDDQAHFINVTRLMSVNFHNFYSLIISLRQLFISNLSNHGLYFVGLVSLNYLFSGNIYLTVIMAKLLNIIFIAAFAYTLFKILAREAGPRWVYPGLVVLLTIINPDIFFAANKLVTEIPFIFTLLGSIYCFETYLEEKDLPRAARYLILGIIAFLLASFLRDVGYLLVPVMAIYGAIRKKPIKTAVFLALFAIPALFELNLLKSQVLGQLEHMFANMPGFIGRCFWYSKSGIPQILVPFRFISHWPALAYAITVTVIAGFFFKVTKKIRIMDLYSLCYIFLFLTYREVSGRWLIPIIPFLIYYFLYGITGLAAIGAKALRSRVVLPENDSGKVAMAVVIALTLAYGYLDISYVVNLHKNSLFYPPIAKNYAAAAEFIARNNFNRIHIMSAQPGFVGLYSGMEVNGINSLDGPDIQWQRLITGGYDFIIASRSDQSSLFRSEQYLMAFIRASGSRLKEVFNSDDKVRVYEVVKDIKLQLTDEKNLLQDPEFELKDHQGNYLKWTKWGGGGLAIQSAVDIKGALIFARQDAGHDALKQEVIIDKKKTYILSFNAATDRPGSFRVDFAGKRIVVTEKAETKYYLAFIPDEDNILIELRQRSPGKTWLSNVRLYEASVQKEYKFEGVFADQQPYQLEFTAKTDQPGSGRCEIYADGSLISSIKIDSLEWKPYTFKMARIPYKPTFLFVQREIGSVWINKVKLVNLISGEVAVLYDK